MDWSVNIFRYNSLTDENGVLVVVTFPSCITYKYVLTQWNFAVVCWWAVGNNLTFFNCFAFGNNRSLIYTCALVRAHKFNNIIFVGSCFTCANCNFISAYSLYDTVVFSNDNNAGVVTCLVFHTCCNNRCFRAEKRHSLTLHVGTHKGTVGVIVFQERNHSRSNWNQHSRRNVHIVDFISRSFKNLVTVTGSYVILYKVSVFVQRFVSLCNNISVLNIGCHVNNFVCNNACLFINPSVRCFDKAVNVNSCVSCNVGNQTDVRAFRSFDRTHSAVVRIMYVTNFKSGTVSWKTAGAQGWKSSLMSKLGKRVCLIHELWQLWRAEELLDNSRYRFDVDKAFRCDCIPVLLIHSLTDCSFHTNNTCAELCLQKFDYASDTTVAKVVDIVIKAYAVGKAKQIADCCKNIIYCNVFRNKSFTVGNHKLSEHILVVAGLIQKFFQYSKGNFFVNAFFIKFQTCDNLRVNHTVWNYSYNCAVLFLNVHYGNTVVFDYIGKFFAYLVALVAEYFACERWNYHFGGNFACNSVCNGELFVKFISAESWQIVSSRIEEKVVNMCLWVFNRRRFARTEFSVNFQQTFFFVWCDVFEKCCFDYLVIAEYCSDVLVWRKTQSTQEWCDRQFSVLIYTNIENIVHIGFILKPSATVRNNCTGVQFFTCFIVVEFEVCARWTNKLWYDNTLRTVDNECAAVCHLRQIAHVFFLLLDFTGLFVQKSDCNFKRCRISYITLFTFFYWILCLFFNTVVNKLQSKGACMVFDCACISENFFDTFVNKPLVWGLLHFDEVRHFLNFVDFGKIHTLGGAKHGRFYYCHYFTPS